LNYSSQIRTQIDSDNHETSTAAKPKICDDDYYNEQVGSLFGWRY